MLKQEQRKELCKDLPFDKLIDIAEWYENLLQQNERMSADRRSLLCKLLKERVKKLKELSFEF